LQNLQRATLLNVHDERKKRKENPLASLMRHQYSVHEGSQYKKVYNETHSQSPIPSTYKNSPELTKVANTDSKNESKKNDGRPQQNSFM
jgi:hypothetical protein